MGSDLVPGRRVWRARVRLRLAIALALSLNFHGFIVLLELGDPGFSLRGLALPWAGQPVPAADFTVRLAEAPRLPAPAPPPRAAVSAKPPVAVQSSRAGKSFEVLTAPEARAPKPKIQKKPQPRILAQGSPREETFQVPPPGPAEPEAEARRKSEVESRKDEETAQREAEELARQRALALQQELEARKLEEAEAEARRNAEVERQMEEEAARQQALELEAIRLEEARRVEEARKLEEARRREEARRIALEAEALKRAEEAAREQAAAREKELAAQRRADEAAARAREKEIADRQRPAAPAAPAAPPALSGRELAARALDLAGAPPAPAAGPPRPKPEPGSADGARRRAILSVERDVALRMYVESWRVKIERNGPLNFRASAARRAADYPVVTVAIRSDGSVEDIVIHRSSGVRELDEAVRRIARFLAPYSIFPPALAHQYDVIEIRRIWEFGDTLRILQEPR